MKPQRIKAINDEELYHMHKSCVPLTLVSFVSCVREGEDSVERVSYLKYSRKALRSLSEESSSLKANTVLLIYKHLLRTRYTHETWCEALHSGDKIKKDYLCLWKSSGTRRPGNK